MHGGTNPGAPIGNRNALRHGARSGELAAIRQLLRSHPEILAAIGVASNLPAMEADHEATR